MEPKKGPQTTKNRPQEASKCLLERRCGFQARSNSILSDFGLQHSLNMGSKIAQKTLKNQLGRPKPPKGRREASRDAFFTPNGAHFAPFWAPKMVQNLLLLTLSPLDSQDASRKAFRAQLVPILRQGTSQEKPSEPPAHENSVQIAGQKSFGHRCRPVLAKPLAQWPGVGALAPLEIRPLSL